MTSEVERTTAVAVPVTTGRCGYARVALDIPIAPWFDYAIEPSMQPPLRVGDWVVVPWGRARKVGFVLALSDSSSWPAERIRVLDSRLDDAPATPPHWLALAAFAARYYHRHPGEVMLPAVPKLLRAPPSTGPRARGSVFARARRRFAALTLPNGLGRADPPPLNPAQADALAALKDAEGFQVFLLHGVTGSGKTEVYLQWIAQRLARDPAAQVLLLVPEIALTPQLAAWVGARFSGESVAILHSGLPEGERAAHWLAAAEGRARILIGTRLAVLAPIPGLSAIVVDEEHDASFKQQEGVRYSARDLAVMMGRIASIPVLLGSATPSLESWHAVRAGRYRLLSMPQRASGAAAPTVRIVTLEKHPPAHGLGAESLAALKRALDAGAQAMVFLNRRGYAPVLNCGQCGWLSQCDACAAYRVLHRAGRGRFRLICHHCGGEQPVPRACPVCGDADLQPLGLGTQRLEEALAAILPGVRIARLDRDVARHRGAAQAVLEAMHDGDVDLIVGTQMLAKGHDFQRLRLVVVADPDAALFSSDFRAPERLFATLTQVAGRAGRTDGLGEVIVQTRYPGQHLFDALLRHDFIGFADQLLDERRQAGLPPWRFQALLRAEATTIDEALSFLADARLCWLAQARSGADETDGPVDIFDPVPMPMARLAGRARAQLLLESDSRPRLHRRIAQWLTVLETRETRSRWQLDIDPFEI